MFGFADIPTLSALSKGLHVARSVGADGVETVLADPAPMEIAPPPAVKGAVIATRFELRDQVDPGGLTLDYLEGFLEGRRMGGLVLRNIRVHHNA